MKGRIQHPMYPAAALAAVNPVLLKGEVVYESDTLRYKIGDGLKPWNSLFYGGSKPLGLLPGYREISRVGMIDLGDVHGSDAFFNFDTRFDEKAIIGRHIMIDAEIHRGGGAIISLPCVLAKIVDTSISLPVIDFTTGYMGLIGPNCLLANLHAHIEFLKMDSLIIGCRLIAQYSQVPKNDSGSDASIAPFLIWYGIYLEELPDTQPQR